MYTESKKTLDKIRRKDEIMFRMAISHLMDVGIRHLTEENIRETCQTIRERDDSNAFMSNDFACDLLVMAGELAKIPHTDLLVYIQREIEYDVGDEGMPYSRVIHLLKGCVNIIERENGWEPSPTLYDLKSIGFDDDEIEGLGFGYLLDVKEEN